MSAGRYEIDMSKGSILKNMLAFAIPLMLSNIMQLLYNAADVIVVGRWGGQSSLAAVGATSSLMHLLTNLFIGLSVGASVAVSKRYGAGDLQGLDRTVHTTVTIGILSGTLSLVIGEVLCKPILQLMGTPSDVIDLAVLYMRIIFIGVPAQMIYNFGAAILRSVGDTRRPLYILSVSGVINVVLNLILVIVFHLNVAGVAMATAIAHYISAGAVMYSLVYSDTVYRINLKKLKFHKEEAKEIFSIGLPAGLQSSVFSLSNMVVQSAVNSFGTITMAGRSAAANIEAFVYTSMNSFYHATLTSIGQNYGAKKERRIYRTIYTGLGCAIVVGLILGISAYVFGEFLLGFYIVNSPEAVKEGMISIAIINVPYFLCGIMEVMTGVLRGLGHSKTPAISSLFGACGLRLLWIFVVLPLNHTTWLLYLCWPVSWAVVICLHTLTFFAVRKKSMLKMMEE